MVATLSSEEVQVAIPVTSREVLSLRMAVAAKRTLRPAGVVTAMGDTWISLMVALEIVRVVLPIRPMYAAVTVTLPAARPVACPRVPPAFEICATIGLLEVQVAMPVTFWVVKSE